MTNEIYMKLLTEINERGLDTDSAVEVMAWHNQTGTPVKQLCGLPEKIVLQRLIESYLSIRAEREEIKADNAALRERLEKAVELKEPYFEEDQSTGLYVVYYEQVVEEAIGFTDRTAAEKRLAELKG